VLSRGCDIQLFRYLMMSTSNSIILPDIEVTPEEEEAWQAFSNNLTQNSSQSNVVETTLLAESTKQQ